MGPVILSGITKFVDAHAASGSETSFREMKSFAFQAVGLLAHRMPDLFREKGEMAVRLFDALKAEDQSLRLTIQDALNALSLAYKGAEDVIRPHLPDLVSCMLESLSSLEDQRLNYIELHSVNIGIQSEKLENLRVAVAKDSAMWETLDVCLKVIDVQSLDHLVTRLAQLVRSGVGLNTRFNDDKDVCNLFDELWEEISSSESVTLQLYLGEVVSLLCDFLTSTSWASKKKSAKAIRRLSDVLGKFLSVSHQDLLKCLLQEMPGRLWEGKESILHAVAALSTSCHKAMSAEDPSTPNTVIKAVSSACLKKSKSYRDAAYSSLQQIADGMEEERSLPVDKVIDCVAACISVADMKDVMEQRDGLVNVLLYAFSPRFPWTVKVSVLSAVRELFAKFNSFPLSACESPSLELSSFVNEVHVAASEFLLDMIKVFQAVSGRQVEEKFKDELLHLLDVEKNEVAKSLLKQCIESCCGIYLENS